MEWFEITNEVIALITGLCGLIGTGIGVFFAVKNWVKILKTKNKKEVWSLIMHMADAAMTEAEQSLKFGVDKKTMVMESVKASCKAAGLNFDDFIDQLDGYIEQSIKFFNDMKKATDKGDTSC